MIAKPTTEQILNDCSRELMEVVLPAVTDETVQVTIYMMDLVLRNAAVRAAHEIAWMTEETAELEAFADSGAPSTPVGASLHLDDVVERYRCASEAFSAAMEQAVAAGDDVRTRQGTTLLARRVDKEQEIMCGWSPVGR
jgi:fructose-specific component phosphotransferase system IIB-like protein